MTSDTTVLRYLRPAETWTEALPVGNGRLGGMIFAGPMEDTIALNEETLWGRSPADPNRPDAKKALGRVRSLIFEGRLLEAQEIALTEMVGDPGRFSPYEPLGDLTVTAIGPVDYADYVRELDVSTAIARARFTLDGVRQEREYFASAIDDVIAIRYRADGRLPKMKLMLGRCDEVKVRDAGSPPPMPGQAASQVSLVSMAPGSDPRDHILLMSGTIGGGGVDFVAGVSMRVDGPALLFRHWDERAPHVLFSADASEVTMLVTAETTFHGQSLEKATVRVLNRLIETEEKGFERVRADHIAEYQAKYGRFSLCLRAVEEKREDPVPVPELLRRVRAGNEDIRAFLELFINYCRYLLLSSSRPGGLPSNLQGIWNARRWPSWESDFHPNINLQENYWAADAMGLPETVEPLLDWIESTLESGRITARSTYDCDGWVMNHISNAWGFTAPGDGVYGIWPFGGAWILMNVYDHYLYTLDGDLLRNRLYPMMRESARFFLDFLVEGPVGTAAEGYLVTVPSNSPENFFFATDDVQATMTYGSTMDTEIIKHLFGSVLEAVKTLQVDDPEFDADFAREVRAARQRLLPVKVSPSTGGIQEWAEDYREVDPGHRHVSALYGVYPGRSINRMETPELAEAAAYTIDRKFASGYEAGGWCLAWIAAIRGRLGDGDGALDAIAWAMRDLLFQNLFIESHTCPQVGDMQGVPAAVLELLVDSDLEHVVLLPALPTTWKDGSVRGLRLRGNRELAMTWKSGQVVRAEIVQHESASLPEVRVGVAGDYSITRNDARIVVRATAS